MVAGALARAQQHDRQQAQLEELRALARVSEAVTAPQYLDEMLHVVTDMAAQTMNAAVCSIFLLDERGETLEMRSAKRTSSPYRQRSPQPVEEGVVGWVVRHGKGTYVRNVQEDPRYANRELARTEGLVSMLCEPLSVRDKVIGVLACYTNEERSFSEEQAALFSTVANQTALAIENAQLITNAAIVREMHHRIKNNLQSVAMLMQMQIPDAEGLDTRQVLETNINRIRSIASVHEALSERGYRMVDVKDVLIRVTAMTAETMMPPGSAIQVTVEGEELLLPSRAATDLSLVVNELVQNALSHAFVGRSRGRVVVSLGSSPDELIILVRDDGNGMPASPRPGLGLEIAETLVTEDLRGKFKINRLQQGTEFSIRLQRTVEQ
jgi:two-component sensor histidine kinase